MMVDGIGNYVYVRTLGAGNFAQVKLARHRQTSLEVAIKIIDKTQLDSKTLSKLHREVRIMKQLNHHHIVRLYEVLESQHHLYLVMDFASGGELYDFLIGHGRMKEKDARRKFLELFSAVKYCHDKHIIHRDLKAENLLLDGEHRIKVADFGFGNTYDPRNVLETFCGSPPYAAPELFQGIAYVGPEVDVWSMGVILYMMTTSSLPFDGKTFADMKQLVCRGHYSVPFYISSKLQRLLSKMISVSPASRASLDLLLDDPWLNDEGNIRDFVVPPQPNSYLPRNATQVDESIVQLMVAKYKLDRLEIIHSVKQESYDGIYAMYRMHLRDAAKRPIAIQVPSPNDQPVPSRVSEEHTIEGEDSPLPVFSPRMDKRTARAPPSVIVPPSPVMTPVSQMVPSPAPSPRVVPLSSLPPLPPQAITAIPVSATVPKPAAGATLTVPHPSTPTGTVSAAAAAAAANPSPAASPGPQKKRRQRSHTIGARASVPNPTIPMPTVAEAPPTVGHTSSTAQQPPAHASSVSGVVPTQPSVQMTAATPPNQSTDPTSPTSPSPRTSRMPILSRRRMVVISDNPAGTDEREEENADSARRVAAAPLLEVSVSTPASPDVAMFQRSPALRIRRSVDPQIIRSIKRTSTTGAVVTAPPGSAVDTETESPSPPASPRGRLSAEGGLTTHRGSNDSGNSTSPSISPLPSPRGSPKMTPQASIPALKPRTIRLPLSTANTTSKNADQIMERIFIVASVLKLEAKQMAPFVIQVLKPRIVHFEVEICYVPILRLHGLRISRLSGPADTYKMVAELFLRELKL